MTKIVMNAVHITKNCTVKVSLFQKRELDIFNPLGGDL